LGLVNSKFDDGMIHPLLYTSAYLATFLMTFALLVGPDWYVAYMMISAIWT